MIGIYQYGFPAFSKLNSSGAGPANFYHEYTSNRLPQSIEEIPEEISSSQNTTENKASKE